MRHTILDTDPGIDDALAFMLALSSPEIEIEAVTTVDGNVSQQQEHENAKRLLEFLERPDIPVAQGAERPLLRSRTHAESYHGKTGLGDAILPKAIMKSDQRTAAQLITEIVEQFENKITIVAIGPLTNIALSIMLNPELPKMIEKLVIMGGAYNVTAYGCGNSSAVAEFNIWHDPEAAKIVFDSGIPMVCTGLDVTTHPENRLNRQLFSQIEEMGTKRSRLVVDLIRSVVVRYDGISLHDPLAIAYIINSSLFQTKRYRVNVETRGEFTEGMTVIDRRRWYNPQKEENIEIITEVDSKRFLNIIMNRIPSGD